MSRRSNHLDTDSYSNDDSVVRCKDEALPKPVKIIVGMLLFIGLGFMMSDGLIHSTIGSGKAISIDSEVQAITEAVSNASSAIKVVERPDDYIQARQEQVQAAMLIDQYGMFPPEDSPISKEERELIESYRKAQGIE